MKRHIRRLISQFVSSLSESIALAPSLRKLRSGALLCVLALVSIVAVFTQAKESVFFFGGVLVAEAKICPVRNLKLVKVVNATNEIETNRLLFSRVVRSYSHGPGELLPLFWRNNGFVRFSTFNELNGCLVHGIGSWLVNPHMLFSRQDEAASGPLIPLWFREHTWRQHREIPKGNPLHVSRFNHRAKVSSSLHVETRGTPNVFEFYANSKMFTRDHLPQRFSAANPNPRSLIQPERFSHDFVLLTGDNQRSENSDKRHYFHHLFPPQPIIGGALLLAGFLNMLRAIRGPVNFQGIIVFLTGCILTILGWYYISYWYLRRI